jgi:hypothetical protein
MRVSDESVDADGVVETIEIDLGPLNSISFSPIESGKLMFNTGLSVVGNEIT